MSDSKGPEYDGMTLMMTNKFEELYKLFDSKQDTYPRVAMLNNWLHFAKAMSSFGDKELEDALAFTWKTEKVGKEMSSASVKNAQIEGKLIQADCHLLGGQIQFVQGAYVKAAWNIRKSWTFYRDALKEVEASKDTGDLEGWADFGVGFFNLLVAGLPGTVLKIAEWVGFRGDHAKGLSLLRKAHESGTFMAPIAALVLLSHHLTISTFLGNWKPEYMPESKKLIEWGEKKYPASCLFAGMESRYYRQDKDLKKAIDVAKEGLKHATIPALSVMFDHQLGWCAFFMQEWAESVSYFEPLLAMRRSGHLFDEHAEKKDGEGRRPPRTSAQAVYAYQIGLCYALLDNWDKAKEYWKSAPDYITKKKRPVEVLLSRQAKLWLDTYINKKNRHELAVLAAVNMINMWNGFSQMPQAALAKALTALDNAQKTGEFDSIDTARCNMLRGSILHFLGKDDEALASLNKTIAAADELQGSDAGKQSAALPMAYAELATIYLAQKSPDLDKANSAIKTAAAIKGYDMYRPVQLKLHALRNFLRSWANRPCPKKARPTRWKRRVRR